MAVSPNVARRILAWERKNGVKWDGGAFTMDELMKFATTMSSMIQAISNNRELFAAIPFDDLQAMKETFEMLIASAEAKAASEMKQPTDDRQLSLFSEE